MRRCASSISYGRAEIPMWTRAAHVSSRSTALSGSCRPEMYRLDSFTDSTTASSRIRTLCEASYLSRRPRSMRTVASSPGSSSFTSWNLRASAGSFSKYFLYSDQVVAAMVRSSPRASAGLSRLAASPPPAAPPAPIIVWASSMNRMIGLGDSLTSVMTAFSRFSNSPLTPAPAWSSPRSSPSSSTPDRIDGTSPSTMRSARPSTTAVLPTPASPTTIGLFFLLRPRISIICRISRSRPNTGSISPARARPVKSSVKRARADSPSVRRPPATCGAAPGAAPSAGASSGDPATIVSSFLRSSSLATLSRRSTKAPLV